MHAASMHQRAILGLAFVLGAQGIYPQVLDLGLQVLHLLQRASTGSQAVQLRLDQVEFITHGGQVVQECHHTTVTIITFFSRAAVFGLLVYAVSSQGVTTARLAIAVTIAWLAATSKLLGIPKISWCTPFALCACVSGFAEAPHVSPIHNTASGKTV